jgi:predicted aldo/keto reductase-like oxidoreductase
MNRTYKLDRRGFLKAGLQASAATTAVWPDLGYAQTRPDSENVVTAYKRLGRTNLEIADISFGSSRLREGEEHLVSHALERGVNYFDTADSYTRGASETVLGNVLGPMRDKVILATKTQAGSSTSAGKIMRSLEGSLNRLRTDYVDVFFNHAVNSIARLENEEWFEFAERAKQEGKIRFTGISGHAGRLIDVLDHAVTQDQFDVFLVSHNFGQDPEFYESLTRSFDLVARLSGLPEVMKRAKEKDIGIIAMKTLMGARLNDMRPYEAGGSTFAQSAFKWTLSNDWVDALIISMTSTEAISEYLGASGATSVARSERALLERYARVNGKTYCRHACNDCEGACPFGVQIADVLRTRMYATDYGDVELARDEYAKLDINASACASCSGAPCQSACSQGIDIAAFCAPTHGMLA